MKIEKLQILKELAICMVYSLFDGVKDKGGKPYTEHCKTVAHLAYSRANFDYLLTKREGDEPIVPLEIFIAGTLHDVVEDTEVTIEMIRILFGKEIARLVDLVTRKEGESYMQFIDRVKTCPKATLIKKCDIMHNSDLSRLETVTDFDLARFKKYEKALKRLDARA